MWTELSRKPQSPIPELRSGLCMRDSYGVGGCGPNFREHRNPQSPNCVQGYLCATPTESVIVNRAFANAPIPELRSGLCMCDSYGVGGCGRNFREIPNPQSPNCVRGYACATLTEFVCLRRDSVGVRCE